MGITGGEMTEDFNRLYARVFYAGAYRHAAEVRKVDNNPERGLLGQYELLDCCYHAGAAVEQLIYGYSLKMMSWIVCGVSHLGVAIAFCYRSMIQGIIRVSSVAIHGI